MTASDSPTAPQALLGPMRLPFLILTPACVLLGIGAAFYQSGRVDLLQVVIVLIGALAAHISVNALNEYFDFRSGLDLRTQRTPFSGGSGTLAAQPAMAFMSSMRPMILPRLAGASPVSASSPEALMKVISG